MKFKLILKNTLKLYLEKYYHSRKLHAEIRKFKDPRRKAIYSKVKLSSDQEKKIDEIFVNYYGKKVSYIWHRHYTAFTGNFDPYYIPEILFIPEFESYMNYNRSYINVFADKNVISIIAAGVGVHIPETIISKANGILRDNEYQLINWKRAEEILSKKTCFVKPSIDSDSGRGCILLDSNKGDMISALKGMGDNFIVQERIICSESIAKIYSNSVNTFRVMTYIWDGDVVCAPIIMRIGQGGSFLDNAHAGGMFIAINDDGTLHKKAFTEFRDEFFEHPDTHVAFEGYIVNNFDKIIASAKKMHSAIPQLGVINWDFTIDKNEEPILIEANTSGGSIWLFQMAWGCGVFGKNTPAILEWLRGRNNR